MSKTEFVQAYYDLWMGKNNSSIEDFFTEDAVYVEAYGPEHLGQEALKRWFADWTGKAKVLQWRIMESVETETTVWVKWFFSFQYEGQHKCCDGVSIAEFAEDGRIETMMEYQSEHEHYHPYN